MCLSPSAWTLVLKALFPVKLFFWNSLRLCNILIKFHNESQNYLIHCIFSAHFYPRFLSRKFISLPGNRPYLWHFCMFYDVHDVNENVLGSSFFCTAELNSAKTIYRVTDNCNPSVSTLLEFNLFHTVLVNIKISFTYLYVLFYIFTLKFSPLFNVLYREFFSPNLWIQAPAM